MAEHNGMKFSAKGVDNDSSGFNCQADYKGGWWYSYCYTCNLNGIYYSNPGTVKSDGITWYTWHGYLSLKKIKMMIIKK